MILLTTALALSSSCSYISVLSNDENTVMSRAEKRLHALYKLDYATAYKYMSPGYRSMNDLKLFSADYSGASEMDSYKITKVDCESIEVCSVHVITYYNSSIFGLGSPSDEDYIIDYASKQTWIKLGNQWWFSK